MEWAPRLSDTVNVHARNKKATARDWSPKLTVTQSANKGILHPHVESERKK